MKVFLHIILIAVTVSLSDAPAKVHGKKSAAVQPTTAPQKSATQTDVANRGVGHPAANANIQKQAVNFIDVDHRTRAPSFRVGNTANELIQESTEGLKKRTTFFDTANFGPPNTRLTNCKTERSGETRCDLSINGRFVSSGILNLPSDGKVQTLAGRAKHPSKNGVSFSEVLGGKGVQGVHGFTPDQPLRLRSDLQVQPEDFPYYYATDLNTQTAMGLNVRGDVVSPGDPTIATILFRFPSGSTANTSSSFSDKMSGKSSFSGGEISMQGGGGMGGEPPV